MQDIKIHCLFEKLIDPKTLKDNPKNRNKHGQDQIERLAELYSYQGVRHPIVVSNLTGFIVAGHGRKLAAIRSGIKEMPVVYQDFDSLDQEYAFIQSDNAVSLWAELDLSAINADIQDLGPDFDINMLGIQDFTLDVAEKDFEGDPDEVPEVVEPIAKLGQIYKLGEHRLMCGDSTDPENISILFDGKNAELCFTSPPYSDQRNYNGGKELSTEYLATFIRAAKGFVKYFAVNLGYSRKSGEIFPYWDDYINEAKNCGLKFLSWNIWDRGHAFSIGQMTAMFPIEHEWIFVFGPKSFDLNRTVENKSGGTIHNHSGSRKSDGSVKKQKDMQIRSHRPIGTVLRQPPQMGRDEFNHPARFPVELVVSYVDAMTEESDGVFEPFGGSGSTLIACEKTNRKCFMMELDPHYVDVIIARWEKFTGKKAELLNG